MAAPPPRSWARLRILAGAVSAVAAASFLTAAARGGTCDTLSPGVAKVRFEHERWDLRDPDALRRLIARIEKKLADAPSDDSDRRALVEMKTLAAHALASPGSSCEALAAVAEIGDSLHLGKRVPVRRRIDLFEVPFYYYDLMHNPVGIGDEAAWNLASKALDTSRVDPAPTSFWSRPRDIASRDLYEAFGPILRVQDQICTYDEPKTSYGTTPGFSVTCGGRRIKVKFGKESSKRDTEVAVTRLYSAVGFHVEPNDYSPEIRVRYDRRVLLEFNSRKDLSLTITALGVIPVGRVRIQAAEDPFQYVHHAVTKTGAVLSRDELARGLIRGEILSRSPRAARKLPSGTHPSHYRDDAEAYERELDALVMVEGNVQLRDGAGENIGPWDWDRLDHCRRRELRGAALLAAWTNYFDARWDNNRLKLVKNGDGEHLRHYISDLGGSLGRAENFRADTQGLVNDFPWTFTEAPVLDENGRERKPFRIVGYQPILDVEAFRQMTMDDARWMARLIAQVSENQLKQALIATGYTSAEVRLYTEKLVSRRDRMIQDLGLSSEIAPLRPNGVDPAFDYDPREDGPLRARAADGSELRPIESRDLVVRDGHLEPR